MQKKNIKRLGVFIGGLLLCLFGIFAFVRFHDFSTEDHIVAVLDSGVKSDHKMMEGHVIPGFNFVDWNRDTSDVEGHGTHVSGIIMNQSPTSKILPIKTLDEGSAPRMYTIFGIFYAIVKGADVINMSYGGKTYDLFTQMTINLASQKGIIFVASAGNNGENMVNYPAKFKNVIGVGNSNEGNEIAKNSNFGEGMDFLAPGMHIESAGIEKEKVEKSGTSMSAAYVSGVVSYLQVEEHIKGIKNMRIRLKEGSNSTVSDASVSIIDQEKIIAEKEGGLYTFMSTPARYVKDGKVKLKMNTLHANQVTMVYNYKTNMIQNNGDVNQTLELDLPNGWNHFTLWAKNEQSAKGTNIYVLVDQQSPNVEVSEITSSEGKMLLKVHVEDEAIKEVKIIERNTGIIRIYNMEEKKEFNVYIDSKETNYTIIAADMLNQTTTMEYKKE